MADSSDNELSHLVSTSPIGTCSNPSKTKLDWSRFGLSTEQQKETEKIKREEYDETYQHDANKNELFAEEQDLNKKPWWKTHFFISVPVLFGTWDGVFTSCMINIFGIIIFLRTGWMVGNAGIGLSVLIILMTIAVALVSALSAIGVCERCNMESGGVYFLLSHVLGDRIGAAIGIVYCFGQAVACSLYTMGFAESVSALLGQSNEWVSRGIAAAVILLLLAINVAGVKWVIRLQLLLLITLLVAVLDFVVGSFVHTDYEHGVVGYMAENIRNNTGTDYNPGESFFTVFGVFFPTATGVFAGINMSGDLRRPSKDIPLGTLSAVGVSTMLYLVFAFVLSATCQRDVLKEDYMIGEKVAVVGVLWLLGLYISSISSCMGALYGSPRILQSIANNEVIPIIKKLGHGRGPNKVPIYALLVITLITFIFILIGKVNTLGPVVTMPFMLTYAAMDYAYFALAMSFDSQKQKDSKYKAFLELSASSSSKDSRISTVSNGIVPSGAMYGSLGRPSDINIPTKKGRNDLDILFPERLPMDQQMLQKHIDNLPSPSPMHSPQSEHSEKDLKDFAKDKPENTTEDEAKDDTCTSALLDNEKSESSEKAPAIPEIKHQKTEITKMPRSCYSVFCNRWISLFGVLASLVIMFAIQWAYALANLSVIIMIYAYIGQANPGVFPGIADFNMYQWIRDSLRNCCRRGPPPPEQVVITPNAPTLHTWSAQLTEDNDDFASRGRYHQSEIIHRENFDDYQ